MSQRHEYLAALREAAHHVVAHILAPDFGRRHAVLGPLATASPPLLDNPSTEAHTRVEVLSRFGGLAAVFLGARARGESDEADLDIARALLRTLGDEAREDTYRREAEGFVRAHFLTIRAVALQLLQAGTLDAEEVGLIAEVAEGRAPLRVLQAYRSARAGRAAP